MWCEARSVQQKRKSSKRNSKTKYKHSSNYGSSKIKN